LKSHIHAPPHNLKHPPARQIPGNSSNPLANPHLYLLDAATLEARVEHSAGLQAQITALRQRLGGSV
jgi:hypothetical protein